MNRIPIKPTFLSLILISSLAVIDLILFYALLVNPGRNTKTPVTPQPISTITQAVDVEPSVTATHPVFTKNIPFPKQAAAPIETHERPVELSMDPVKIINGIEIELSNIRHENDRLNANICFSMPNNEDWMIKQLSLRYDGNELTDWGGLVIDPILPAANGKPGRRCDMVYFFLPDHVDLSEFTITVVSIWAPPREGGACQRVDTVQWKLAEQGIKINCHDEVSMEGYEIVAKPASMSQEEAENIVSDALWFKIQGPWEFTIHPE